MAAMHGTKNERKQWKIAGYFSINGARVMVPGDIKSQLGWIMLNAAIVKDLIGRHLNFIHRSVNRLGHLS